MSSKSRYFGTKFWRDSYIEKLDPSEKLLYIYLFTNPEAQMCGIYEMSQRLMSLDTGFSKDMLEKLFTRLGKDRKVIYHDGWVCVLNTIKHQNINNGNTRKGIERELREDVPIEKLEYFLEHGTPAFRDMLEEFGVSVPEYNGEIVAKVRVEKRKVPRAPKKEIVVIELPDGLNTEAWAEWSEYRTKTKRKTITDAAAKKQWKVLLAYTHDEQQQIIDKSIQNDYQGLFPLQANGMQNKKKIYGA